MARRLAMKKVNGGQPLILCRLPAAIHSSAHRPASRGTVARGWLTGAHRVKLTPSARDKYHCTAGHTVTAG